MIGKLLAVVVVALALLLTTGAFSIEGRMSGAMGGRLAVRARNRRLVFAAVTYRPGKVFYRLNATR